MKTLRYIFLIFVLISTLFAVESPHCLYFGGDSSYVHINSSPLNFERVFTIESWFNVYEFLDSAALIDNSMEDTSSGSFYGYGIYTLDSNRITIRMGNDLKHFNLIVDNIKSNIWYHLAITYDKYKNDENVVVFLNGQIVKKADCNIYMEYPETFRPFGVYLGAFYDYPFLRSFKGEIDEVRFWSVIRTNEQIRNSMNKKLSNDETGLAGYYTFDQLTNSLLFDLSLNENHGELINMSDSSWQLSYAQLAVEQPMDISFDRLVLSWIAPSSFNSHCVDLSATSDFATSYPGFPVYDINTDYYIIDDIIPGTYYYRVKGHYEGEDLNNEPWTDIQIVSTITDAATAIELDVFEALPDKNHILISWQTTSQTENAKFILERRTENTPWECIYETPGAGTNSIRMSYEFEDKLVKPQVLYSYRIKDLSYSGNIDSSKVISTILNNNTQSDQAGFILEKVYPNPFNPQVSISFTVTRSTDLLIEIYSTKGKMVDILSDRFYQSGSYEVNWIPNLIPSGIYLLKLKSNDINLTHKLLYLK
ncbi:MAG: LamG-like jellyroll fold domain-containing protein [Candidatus Marinimicrobia bacterium]|nr:LamG-like jellyroll fold domain-containing protein [Candidatus Neomarinimicrobiota bacterium]